MDSAMEKKPEDLLMELMKISELSQNSGNNDQFEAGREFSLSSKNGHALYDLLTNDDLLDIMKNRAKQLGHSPSQKEMFWVLREYIKVRFKKWPTALRLAGLPTSAGGGPKPEHDRLKELLTAVRERAVELGRIPHPKDMPKVCGELGKYMDTWGQVIKAAGIQKCFVKKKSSLYKIKNLEEEYAGLLDKIREKSLSMGRPPLHHEIDQDIRQKLISRCGSWRNALYQIGLEPVMRIKPFSDSYINEESRPGPRKHTVNLNDCYYRILNPSEEILKDLDTIQNTCNRLRRLPTKKEVPAELSHRLISTCGSWQNTLYQLKFNNHQATFKNET